MRKISSVKKMDRERNKVGGLFSHAGLKGKAEVRWLDEVSKALAIGLKIIRNLSHF